MKNKTIKKKQLARNDNSGFDQYYKWVFAEKHNKEKIVWFKEGKCFTYYGARPRRYRMVWKLFHDCARRHGID